MYDKQITKRRERTVFYTEICMWKCLIYRGIKKIDIAGGSCDFSMHIIFYVWKSIFSEKGIPQRHLCILEKSLIECEDYVRDYVFVIDFGTKIVRVGRTLNLIAGDGRMKKQNRDFEFDVLMANPPLWTLKKPHYFKIWVCYKCIWEISI